MQRNWIFNLNETQFKSFFYLSFEEIKKAVISSFIGGILNTHLSFNQSGVKILIPECCDSYDSSNYVENGIILNETLISDILIQYDSYDVLPSKSKSNAKSQYKSA